MENDINRKASEERLNAQVQALWIRLLPRTKERLAELERIANAMISQNVDQKLIKTAAGIAHQMAGALGTFGLPAGTRVARELELELDALVPNPEKVLRLTRELRNIVNQKV